MKNPFKNFNLSDNKTQFIITSCLLIIIIIYLSQISNKLSNIDDNTWATADYTDETNFKYLSPILDTINH